MRIEIHNFSAQSTVHFYGMPSNEDRPWCCVLNAGYQHEILCRMPGMPGMPQQAAAANSALELLHENIHGAKASIRGWARKFHEGESIWDMDESERRKI